MADGSRRAIETLRPGDLVLAADQLNPESAPAPAKVVRFFDNGEKTVVRLRFEGQELVCTPEHPFYVLGKGWVRADGLVEGDLCLNAKGESVAFVSREEIAEKRRVYNIEVEGAHTYFVGDDDGVLAHNVCSVCNGTGQIKVAHQRRFWGFGYDVENVAVDCPFCDKFSVCNYCGGIGYTIEWSQEWAPSNAYLSARGFALPVCSSSKNPCPHCCITTTFNETNRQENISNLEDAGFPLVYILHPERRGMSEADYNQAVANFTRAERIHFAYRTMLNDNESMLSLDLTPLSRPEDKIAADLGIEVHAYFLGDYWTLMTSYYSQYHSKTGDGKDCFKWCSEGGKELVILMNNGLPILALGRNEIGTFNYISPNLTGTEKMILGQPAESVLGFCRNGGHFFIDMLPYYCYNLEFNPTYRGADGNLMDVETLFMKKEHIPEIWIIFYKWNKQWDRNSF